MAKSQPEPPAARVLRMRQQLAELEFLIQRTKSPQVLAGLRVKRGHLLAGLRLVTQ